MVRVNSTVYDALPPAGMVSVDGVIVVLKPAAPVSAADTVSDPPLTFFSVRRIVWRPDRSPIAIEAWLRSLASIGSTPVQPPPGCTPQMKASQSAKPAS